VHHPRTICHIYAKFYVLTPSQSSDTVWIHPVTQLISQSMNHLDIGSQRSQITYQIWSSSGPSAHYFSVVARRKCRKSVNTWPTAIRNTSIKVPNTVIHKHVQGWADVSKLFVTRNDRAGTKLQILSLRCQDSTPPGRRWQTTSGPQGIQPLHYKKVDS